MNVVFVHGALVRDGAWWWHPTAEMLHNRTGVESRSVALPSCGETTDHLSGGLRADAAALRAVLDEVDDAIIVGHSYGGTVIAELGHHPAIRALMYVSSYLPEVGQSQSKIMSDETDPVRIRALAEGLVGLDGYDEQSFVGRFLHDAPPEQRDGAWSRIASQSSHAFTTPVTRAGWRGVDSTYLVCTADRSTSTRLQRFHAAKATRSVDLPTGHHPFVSRPDLVVPHVEAVLRSYRA